MTDLTADMGNSAALTAKMGSLSTTATMGSLSLTANMGIKGTVAGPAFSSAEIGNVGNDKLVITFDAALNESIVPATTAFSTSGITGSPSVSSVAISSAVVTLTLSGDASAGDTITVSYTKPVSSYLQDADGNPSPSFSGESVTNNISSFVAEYQAIYDQFSVKPSSADAAAQNTFVETLVNGAVWSELDRLFILASHASGVDSLLDWINPTGTGATAVNAPGWVQYQGYTSTGTEYVNSNFEPGTHGVNFTRNAAGFGGYTRSDISATYVLIGVEGSADTKVFPRLGSGKQSVLLNGSSSTGASVPSSLGMHSGLRSSSSVIAGYRNAVFVDDNTIAGSNPLETNDIYLLASNNLPSPVQFFIGQISMAYFGGNIGTAKQLILYNAFQTLMTYYGTNV